MLRDENVKVMQLPMAVLNLMKMIQKTNKLWYPPVKCRPCDYSV